MDPRELRHVFGSFVTGVTVVTTVDAQGRYQGVTANSFSSVSLDPPMVLWSQARSAKSFQAFHDADRFIVNILSEHQRDLSQRFATSSPDKFSGITTQVRAAGIPALPECCAYVECRKVAVYPGGDHVVYLGEVLAVERTERRPLAFSRGRYMVAFEHEMNFTLPAGGSEHLAHNEAVRLGCAALPELAKRLGATVGLGVWGNRGPTVIRWEVANDGSEDELRSGIVVSPLTSASGLLFGAYLPGHLTDPVVMEAIAALPPVASPGFDREAYRQRLDGVRAAGFATSRPGSLREMTGLSAPVFDRHGRMVLALCCVARLGHANERLCDLAGQLKLAASDLSARLGHATPAAAGCGS